MVKYSNILHLEFLINKVLSSPPPNIFKKRKERLCVYNGSSLNYVSKHEQAFIELVIITHFLFLHFHPTVPQTFYLSSLLVPTYFGLVFSHKEALFPVLSAHLKIPQYCISFEFIDTYY